MAAVLEPAGSGVAGTQTQGVTKQYQASGTGSSASTLETITPYDSGTILGTVPPGKAGLKLVDGTVQRASQLLADSTPGAVGNALVPTFSTLNTDPTPPSGSQPADGLSQAPNRE
jgi:hypothetical protein